MAFVPSYASVAAEGAEPARWMLILHGILGRGGNWRGFARKAAVARPDWGFVLVDLRMHGASMAAPAPHDLPGAASDIEALASELAAGGRRVDALLGHSFGGKVALALRERQKLSLSHTFIVDASPSPRPGALSSERADGAVRVLRILEALVEETALFDTREGFVNALMDRGLIEGIARWLAMNLEREGESYRFGLDLDAIRALLADYYATDLWPTVEGPGGDLSFVVAGRMSALDDSDRERLAAIEEAGERPVHVHHFPEASHWVHVDALDRLVSLVCERLPRT